MVMLNLIWCSPLQLFIKPTQAIPTTRLFQPESPLPFASSAGRARKEIWFDIELCWPQDKARQNAVIFGFGRFKEQSSFTYTWDRHTPKDFLVSRKWWISVIHIYLPRLKRTPHNISPHACIVTTMRSIVVPMLTI